MHLTYNKIIPVFLCIFASLFLASSALVIPEKPSDYINDYANLLSDSTKQSLRDALANFEKETTNQVVIVTFKSLEEESLEDFSIRLAEKWKIGSKKHDNGIIVLIFEKEHEIRIEVGYGLEGVLPDAVCNKIIRHEMVPAFKEGNFDKGIMNAVNAVISATRGEYKATDDTKSNKSKYDGIFNIIFLIFILFTIFPFLAYILILYLSINLCGFLFGLFIGLIIVVLLETMRKIKRGETLSSKKVWLDSGFWGGGFGGGSFGSGGFSGGGGSFGGGGASGRW